MLATQRSHPSISLALFEAFERNDPEAIEVHAARAAEALAADYAAQRRLEAERAARERADREAVARADELRAAREDANIEAAAQAFARAFMAGSRRLPK
jgi:hypothetical protein